MANASPQSDPRKVGQDKARSVDILVVVPTIFLLLFLLPFAQRDLDIAILVFAANHEADLAAGIGRDGGIGIFNDWKYCFASLLHFGDELEMEPWILGYRIRKYQHVTWLSVMRCRCRKTRRGKQGKIRKDKQPCVVITPPSLNAP